MKTNFFYTLLLFFLGSSAAYSQACPVNPGCTSVNSNFYNTGDGASLDYTSEWSHSHGSTYLLNDEFIIGSQNINSGIIGDGINYSGYNFQAGEAYTICFQLRHQSYLGPNPTNPNIFMNIVGTKGAVNGTFTGANGGGATLPTSPAQSQLIESVRWDNLIGTPGPYNTYTYSFTALDNWDNLWFYVSNPTATQVDYGVKSIVICEVPRIPCLELNQFQSYAGQISDVSFSASGNENNTLFTVTGLYPHQYFSYSWDFGDGNSGSGPSVTHDYIGNTDPTVLVIYEDPNYRTVCLTITYQEPIMIDVNGNIVGNPQSCTVTICRLVYIGGDIDHPVNGGGQSGGGDLPDGQMTGNNSQNATVSQFGNIGNGIQDEITTQIAPNPSNGIFVVSSSNTKNIITGIEVYDMISKRVYSNHSIQDEGRTTIDLQDQESGFYTVRITYSNGTINLEKIVLEK